MEKLQIDDKTTPEKRILLKQIGDLKIKIQDIKFLTAKNVTNSELKIIELDRLKSDLTHQALLVTNDLKDNISDLQKEVNKIVNRSNKLVIQKQIVHIKQQIEQIDKKLFSDLKPLKGKIMFEKNIIKQLKIDSKEQINPLNQESIDLKTQLKQLRNTP